MIWLRLAPYLFIGALIVFFILLIIFVNQGAVGRAQGSSYIDRIP